MSATNVSIDLSITEKKQQLSLEDSVRLCWHCVIFLSALLVITLLAWLFDERTLRDVSVWAKPLKFQLSLILHFATLAIVIDLLPQNTQRTWLVRAVVWSSTIALLGEIIYIMLQASRGRASHFNTETPVEAMMYSAMGIGAVTLVLGSFIIGWLVLQSKPTAMGTGLRWGAGIGLMLGSVATLLVAGHLGGSGGHLVNELGTDAAGLPIVGWSTQTGDLRVAHFFATHTMQFLPLAGWLLDRAGIANARNTIFALAVLLSIIIIACLIQALAGYPFLALR